MIARSPLTRWWRFSRLRRLLSLDGWTRFTIRPIEDGERSAVSPEELLRECARTLPFRVYRPVDAHLVLAHCEVARLGPGPPTLITTYLPEAGAAGVTIRMCGAEDGRLPPSDRTERIGDRLVRVAARGSQTCASFLEAGSAVTVCGEMDPDSIVSVAGSLAPVT